MKTNEKLPLIRLCIRTYESININFFVLENKFNEKVANPGEVILIKKEKSPWVAHQLGTRQSCLEKVKNKDRLGIENQDKISSIVKSFGDTLRENAGAMLISYQFLVKNVTDNIAEKKGCSTLLADYFEDTRKRVTGYFEKEFPTRGHGFGTNRLEKQVDVSYQAGLEEKVKMIDEELNFAKYIVAETQKSVERAMQEAKRAVEAENSSRKPDNTLSVEPLQSKPTLSMGLDIEGPDSNLDDILKEFDSNINGNRSLDAFFWSKESVPDSFPKPPEIAIEKKMKFAIPGKQKSEPTESQGAISKPIQRPVSHKAKVDAKDENKSKTTIQNYFNSKHDF